VPSKFYKGG